METIAVALSEAVDRDLERALRHLELLGELCVGQAFQLRADGGFELFEEMSLARGGVVGLELSHGVVEKVEGPASGEEEVRRVVIGTGLRKEGLGGGAVHGNGFPITSTFQSHPFVVIVGEKAFQAQAEERAEASLLGAFDGLEIVALEKTVEKFLSEVFGFLGSVAATADIKVNRPPVELAELLHRQRVGRILRILGRKHHAPARVGKDPFGARC